MSGNNKRAVAFPIYIGKFNPMPDTRLRKLFLFGSPRLELDGKRCEFSRRKALILLAYLVLHPEKHSRDELAALFWVDSNEEAARLSLRVIISELRKTLGTDALLADREILQLTPGFPLWVDVNEFQDQAEHGTLMEDWLAALELYSGDFLPVAYDDWALECRNHLHQIYIETLSRIVGCFRMQANYSQAIEFARRILVLDPANETAHQQVMICYEALGDRAAALNQYNDCVRSLHNVFAVAPSAETQSIFTRLQKAATRSISLSARPTNLPTPLTSFIGRETELEAVESLLVPLKHGEQAARMVTLTGAGGSGKTRLAIQSAAELVDVYHDGVWWVELAALTHPVDVQRQVAVVLGVQEVPTEPLIDSIVNHLQIRNLLLVLDNCEHLIEACAGLAFRILSSCPQVQILTTSREALGISGEHLYPTPLLTVPDETRDSPEELLAAESVRLFIERARLVLPGFRSDRANLLTILEILRRLDGIPLAIELAAARLRSMSLEQLVRMIDDRFRLLISGDRAALPRQKTLQALIDWSYELLPEPERSLFRRLSIFTSGCTLEGAQAINPDQDLLTFDLLDHLVCKSLITVVKGASGDRYRMLDTIREYASGKLTEAGEVDLVSERVLGYLVRLVDRYEPYLSGQTEVNRYLPYLADEQDNLRHALDWALLHDPLAAIHLAGGLWSYWNMTGQYIESADFLDRALANKVDGMDVAILARATSGAGTMAWNLGDFRHAAELHERAAHLYRQAGDQQGEVFSQHNLAVQWSYLDVSKSYTLSVETLRLARSIGYTRVVKYVLVTLGIVCESLGDLTLARQYQEESLALCRQTGDIVGEEIVLHNLGNLARSEGEYIQAIAYYTASDQLPSANLLTASKNSVGKSKALLQMEDYPAALAACMFGLETVFRLGNKENLIDGLETLMRITSVTCSEVVPVRFAAAAARLRQEANYQPQHVQDALAIQQITETLRASLSPQDFDLAWQEGWHWTNEEIIIHVRFQHAG
jgi:predicted ATPase/DNA-binding SARP family transcriptional activator